MISTQMSKPSLCTGQTIRVSLHENLTIFHIFIALNAMVCTAVASLHCHYFSKWFRQNNMPGLDGGTVLPRKLRHYFGPKKFPYFI